MVIWMSGCSDSENLEGDWDVDDDKLQLSSSPAPRNADDPGPSTWVRQDANGRVNGAASLSYSVEDYVAMGFTKELVLKAIKNICKTSGNGNVDPNQLLELILTLKELGDDSLVGSCSTSGCTPQIVEDEDDSEGWDDEDDAFERNLSSYGSEDEDFRQDISQRDKKIRYLLQMGFPEIEAKMAITRCGLDCAMSILVDSIYASEAVGDEHEIKDNNCIDSSLERKKANLMEGRKKRRKLYGGGAQGNPLVLDCSHEPPMRIPHPMVGFTLPSDPFCSVNRKIPIHATGPPFFYFENVARAPKGVWNKISAFLYGIKPEFVDSKIFSASTRKRGYVHNLPIDSRYTLLPPPMTIFKAFPRYEKWWPSWDPRRKLNCLRTRVASAKVVERIRCALAEDPGNIPAESVQKYVLKKCREGNLVWVGRNNVAPLEPDEMELLLGYPTDHTRGISNTRRYEALGNAFQVDTIAYHLSVLKNMFPNGINVISLFTGIGGAEVALHRLGVQLRTVVSVEVSAANRNIFKNWWDKTQSGKLIEIDRVESLTHARIESLVKEVDGFHLVIGGSPCNNLTGSNRLHRDGLEGEHSVLFHDYVRIVDSVRSIMRTV